MSSFREIETTDNNLDVINYLIIITLKINNISKIY